MRTLAVLSFSVLAGAWSGCVMKTEPPPERYNPPLSAAEVDGSSCGAVERSYFIEASPLVNTCDSVGYSTNPPSSGPHYETWPAYGSYDEPVPRGFWVHALQHGAVVVSYSCTDCDDEIEAARQAIEAVGSDPACCSGDLCIADVSRVILTPDPLLSVPWAASSWGHTLTADCFEPAVFQSFIAQHRGDGDEAVCTDGVDLSDPPC